MDSCSKILILSVKLSSVGRFHQVKLHPSKRMKRYNRKMLGVLLIISHFSQTEGFTPLHPTPGYTYYVEASREQVWPSCPYRFLSYPPTCDSVDLWNAAGINQQWKLVDAGNGLFFLRSSCGSYLSYPDDCNSHKVDMWPAAGINQAFRFIVGDNTKFEYYIEAVGRSQCEYKYLSFPVPCTASSPDVVDFWKATGPDQRFRIIPVSADTPTVHNVGSKFVCPDPFVWLPSNSSNYQIQCTGGGLHMGTSSSLDPATSSFSYIGDALGGTPAPWAEYTAFESRWAPENFEYPGNPASNFIFFADTQESDGKHRIGWVLSTSGPASNAYTQYSSSYLDLGGAAGGDIDVHVFRDQLLDKTYLIWKTDDNSVGSKTTRIWLQEVRFSETSVEQVGAAVVIMDSTGLWWVDSWVDGGSLVEGPEVVYHNGFYYLFFAAGKFCEDTYTEGVARSRSITGPYEKLGVPLLSNGITGVVMNAQGSLQKLVGPGHATYVSVGNQGADWRIVYHASIGENCDRYSFINKLVFGSDGWPYVDFQRVAATSKLTA